MFAHNTLSVCGGPAIHTHSFEVSPSAIPTPSTVYKTGPSHYRRLDS